MNTGTELLEIIRRIDGEGYKAYKQIKGEYDMGDFTLFIDSTQRDPFAAVSRMRVRVYKDTAAFPGDTTENKSREIAFKDYLTRKFREVIDMYSLGNRGSGNSGEFQIVRPGQEILDRNSIMLTHLFVEVRFGAGLPGIGRTVASSHTESMLFEELPKIVNLSLKYENLDELELYEHLKAAEDADFIRGELDNLGLVAFIANKSTLPRVSGVDDRPMPDEDAVLFDSPPELQEDLYLPNLGHLSGMGIPKGITVITGGGYHGKSTLLKAIERGIYNHIPGDGREFVVTNPNAVKIRAEDGRSITDVNITPFIGKLPMGKETDHFSTQDASGSTSQSANILEALEIGADALLIDEDTTATNFMIRDHRMQELVQKKNEPINPFIDKVKSLYREHQVSTILVVGGSGDYLDVADRVIRMTEYKPEDVTEEAKEIANKYQTERVSEGGDFFGVLTERIPIKDSISAIKGKRKAKISHKGLYSIQFGHNTIDIGAIEQIVDQGQTNAIGDAIEYSKRYMEENRTLREITSLVLMDIERNGLDSLKDKVTGNYAEFRKLELAAAINRLRTLEVRQKR